MLLEVSITIAIAMPWRSIVVVSTPHCGPASASSTSPTISARSHGSAWCRRSASEGGSRASSPPAGKPIASGRRRRSASSSSGASSSSTSAAGSVNLIGRHPVSWRLSPIRKPPLAQRSE